MDVWGLLGIPPTTDIARIKSAYARQAKLYHPEEYPEQFKALQSAYKIAMRMAKTKQVGDIPEMGPETESFADTFNRETKEEKSDEALGQRTEHLFDFSGVDAYGDKERFFRQFLLITKNPHLQNNLDVWDYFLNQEEFTELFASTDFRMDFVRTMCGRFGWQRKTILYFERYMNKFHTEVRKPANGKRETELACFRCKKLPRLRLPAFCANVFWGRKGASFHKALRSKLGSSMGRKLDFRVKEDVISYMRLYLFYGESNEDFIERLHRECILGRIKLTSIVIIACFFVILVRVHSIDQREKKESRLGYLMELYDLESDTCSDKEQEEMLRDYERYWEYAEEAIDDVLDQYWNW